jgi:L-serine dehydratase
MRAALAFAERLAATGQLSGVRRIRCSLFGSLGSTGLGHGTPDAILAGLTGLRPEACDPDDVRNLWANLADGATLLLNGTHPVPVVKTDVVFEPRTRLPGHPNAMTLSAWGDDPAAPALLEETYYSIGGGFIRRDGDPVRPVATVVQPMPYASSAALLELCDTHDIGICDVARANEEAVHGADRLDAGLDAIWAAMHACVNAGLDASGTLPGGLGVKRRAAKIRMQLEEYDGLQQRERDTSTEWLHAFARAVNEENASGGRIVTAPTNGAAGIIPAVLHYAENYTAAGKADPDDVAVRFLLTAGAIGSLYKQQASISGAEVGCQGEVGSAASMAAGALAEILGGTTRQVENAAEIAMEHCLGLTCDPIGGLVQIPCIERNAISANKAITAARMALRGDGAHRVSLDQVIATMRATGMDMSHKYKETALGGLAAHVGVNIVEC